MDGWDPESGPAGLRLSSLGALSGSFRRLTSSGGKISSYLVVKSLVTPSPSDLDPSCVPPVVHAPVPVPINTISINSSRWYESRALRTFELFLRSNTCAIYFDCVHLPSSYRLQTQLPSLCRTRNTTQSTTISRTGSSALLDQQ